MSSTSIDYNIFTGVYIHLTAEGVDDDNLHLVDIGDIHMRIDGREYQLDYDTSVKSLIDDTIEITLRPGDFEDAQETFEDCPFDLTMEDLRNPELYTTIFANCDLSSVKLAFKSGEIAFTNEEGATEYVTINAID